MRVGIWERDEGIRTAVEAGLGELAAEVRAGRHPAELAGARLELLSVQPEEPVVTVTADGFQIRVTVTVRTAALQESDLRQVTGATAQERACPYASVPSLTIVRWGGEDLWTLAKRYCSSERLIRETNGLTDEAAMAEAPQYLLIPKTQA